MVSAPSPPVPTMSSNFPKIKRENQDMDGKKGRRVEDKFHCERE